MIRIKLTRRYPIISDSTYQSSSATSHDGLAEAIQLLSCRPSRIYQAPVGSPFVEESHTASVSISTLTARNGP